MKQFLKFCIVSVLGWQVRRLYRTNPQIITVGVVGSIGKTSTKTAIADLLSVEYNVQYQSGNYNDIVTVPLVVFGEELKSLFNPFAWILMFVRNEQKIKRPYPFEVIVLELGTDGPGQIAAFKQYLRLDYAVVTAIAPEHMENFADLTQVAKEELSVGRYSKNVLLNADLCFPDVIESFNGKYESYGKLADATYSLRGVTRSSWGLIFPDKHKFQITKATVSDAEIYSYSVAVLIGSFLSISETQMIKQLDILKPVPGRMNLLQAKRRSTIIDESYNASPDAMMMAIKSLEDYPSANRIALLGNMNELGNESETLHRQVGERCRPGKIDLIVTLGPDANKYLAEEAEKQGCLVYRTQTPYEAGELIESNLREGSVVLVKGSQNGVYAEEAIKPLLAEPEDAQFLVRQTPAWLKKKRTSFAQAS